MTRRCPGFDVDAQASRFIEIFLVIVPGVRKVLNREGWGNRFVCSSGRVSVARLRLQQYACYFSSGARRIFLPTTYPKAVRSAETRPEYSENQVFSGVRRF
jgi:hypothetical protein